MSRKKDGQGKTKKRLADCTTTRTAHNSWDASLRERVQAAVLAGEDEAVLYGQMPKDGPLSAYRAVLDEHPEVFWLSGDVTVAEEPGKRTLRFTRLYPERATTRMQEELEAGVAQALAYAGEGASDLACVGRAYEWFCTHVRYLKSRLRWEDQTAYASLCLREAVCAGISRGFALVLRRMGIDAGMVAGGSDMRALETHAWNWAELGGVRLHVDVTQGVGLYARLGVVGHPFYLVPEEQVGRLRHVSDWGRGGAEPEGGQPAGGRAGVPFAPVVRVGTRKELRAALYLPCAGLRTNGGARLARTLRADEGLFASQEEFEACVRKLVAGVDAERAGFKGYVTYPAQTLVLWG